VLLTIDAGNTQMVIGLYDDATLLEHWRVATVIDRSADEHAMLLAQMLDLKGFDFEQAVTGVAVCSSVPNLTAALRDMTDRWFSGVRTIVLEPGVRTGMPILYNDPKQVGADRIADAIGAFDLYGGPTVVIDFGTATTFEAVSEKGEYLGGAIVPGIGISLDALYGRAAALFRVEVAEPKHVIGKSTAESIQSGTIYGFSAQVDGLVGRFEAELGDCEVVATGGLAEMMVPFCESIDHHEPWLTLHGLRLIFERNIEEG
jgi:type III pantothenate kinase